MMKRLKKKKKKISYQWKTWRPTCVSFTLDSRYPYQQKEETGPHDKVNRNILGQIAVMRNAEGHKRSVETSP